MAAAADRPTDLQGDVVQIAPNGRAKCRACGQSIAVGKPRFGERWDNPFGDGLTTYWFHLNCAAQRRSQRLLEFLERSAPDRERFADVFECAAELGPLATAHPRLTRLARLERATSGRARCKQCRALIEKGAHRCVLTIFDGGRFQPMGFVHLACIDAYVGHLVPATRWGAITGASDIHRG